MRGWVATYTTWRVAIPSPPHFGGGDHPLTLEEVTIPSLWRRWPSPHRWGGGHPLTFAEVAIPSLWWRWPSLHVCGGDHPLTFVEVTIPSRLRRWQSLFTHDSDISSCTMLHSVIVYNAILYSSRRCYTML